jgi:hypothetical protein
MQNVPISARKTKTKEEQAFNLGEFDWFQLLQHFQIIFQWLINRRIQNSMKLKVRKCEKE